MTPPPSPTSPSGKKTGTEYDAQTNADLFVEYAKYRGEGEENDSKLALKTRNELIVRNQALVSFILNKYYSPERLSMETKQEVLQEGNIGLLHAIEGFDHTLGFKFSTYGSWWIKQAINNYLINVNPIIRVPSHIKAAQNKLLKQMKLAGLDIKDLPNISPEDYDISNKMLTSIRSGLRSRQVDSLSKPAYASASGGGVGGGEGGVPTLEDRLGGGGEDLDHDDEAGGRELDGAVLLEAVKDALKAMSKKRRLVLLLRYDVIKEEDLVNLP